MREENNIMKRKFSISREVQVKKMAQLDFFPPFKTINQFSLFLLLFLTTLVLCMLLVLYDLPYMCQDKKRPKEIARSIDSLTYSFGMSNFKISFLITLNYNFSDFSKFLIFIISQDIILNSRSQTFKHNAIGEKSIELK